MPPARPGRTPASAGGGPVPSPAEAFPDEAFPGDHEGDHPGDHEGDHEGATVAAVTPAGRRGLLGRLPGPVRVPLQVLGHALAKAWKDRILGLSAEAAFWQVLSVPPLLIGLLGSLGYLGDWIGAHSVQQIEDKLVNVAAEALTPDVVDSLVKPTLTDILSSGRLDVLSLGFLVSLWAGSSATATFINTTVIAYDQRDVRGPIKTRLMALWMFVIGLVVSVITLPLLVLGPGVIQTLVPDRWQHTTGVLINAVYWPLVVIGLLLVLTSFYHATLPRRIPWRRHLPGALFAVVFFVVAASIVRAYVADVLTTALPYGALAAPIAALLFCFFLGMSLLLGAELNATIQARWPAGSRRHVPRRQRRRAAGLALEAEELGAQREQ